MEESIGWGRTITPFVLPPANLPNTRAYWYADGWCIRARIFSATRCRPNSVRRCFMGKIALLIDDFGSDKALMIGDIRSAAPGVSAADVIRAVAGNNRVMVTRPGPLSAKGDR